MRSILGVAVFLLLLPDPAMAWQAKVVRVHDGDSLLVSTGGRQARVDLYGVDCPELDQAYGKSARNFTADMVSGRSVEVQDLEKNQDGSILALVTDFREGVNLNQELVRNGLAWVVRDHCEARICEHWMSLEDEARFGRVGLWKRDNPVPPWEFGQ